MALVINDDNFKQVVNAGGPVVVDFWAEWCGPCRMVGPIVEALAKDYEGRVVIGKYDVDEGGDAAAEYGVRSIPTILFFKDGQLVDRHVGYSPREVIEAKVKALL